MEYYVFITAAVCILVLRYFRLSILWWTLVWWITIYSVLKFSFTAPIPVSSLGLYMGITTLILAVYVITDTERFESVKNQLLTFLISPKYQIPLIALLIALPIGGATKVYFDRQSKVEAPVFGRSVHPAPPQKISFQGKLINLLEVDNPYRPLDESNPEKFRQHLDEGRKIYFQNCYFCHGDRMEGKGHLAYSLDPIPTNFAEPTTIANLTESFLFWRIAKGGIGLPAEGGPWASAMPAWEEFLTEEEIWDVILFLYDYTGRKPRAKEEIHE